MTDQTSIKTRKQRRRRLGDIATYRRLLSYLKGEKRATILVFMCIALESLFTVTTISVIKPVLDLLGDEPLMGGIQAGKAGRTLEFDPLRKRADGATVISATGEAASAKDAQNLRSRVAHHLTATSPLILDLSALQDIRESAWEGIAAGVAQAEGTSSALCILLPQRTKPPAWVSGALVSDAKEAVTSVTARIESGAHLIVTSAPPAPEVGAPVPLLKLGDRIKARAIGWVAPRAEAIQRYSEESPSNKFRVLGALVGAMLVSACCMVAAGFGVGYISSYLAGRVVQRLRDDVFRHMLTLDLAHFTSHSTGSQMSVVIQDVQAVSGAIDILFGSVFKTPVTVAMLTAAMFAVSPRLTLFTFIVIPLLGVLIFALGRRVRKVSGRVQKAKGVQSVILEEAFSGMRVVKAYNMEEREAKRFYKENERILKLGMRTVAAEEVGTGATQLLGVATVGLMLLAGGYMVVVTGELKYSSFFLFVGFLTQVFRPLKGVSKTNAKLQRGLAGSDRVFHVLDLRPAIADLPNALAAAPLRDAIELRDVRFRYGADRPWALGNISLRLAAGRSVALVGHAGCGKSTLANLVPRFYDPTEGSVTWDGTDLRDLQVASLRDQIALITQDVILFDDTVANNIAYGTRGAAARERIEEAARAARAHDFIMRMPEGYDTFIGSRGVRLSGGERQRLAIARAILKGAPVLVLDEATSALDSETESLVQAALSELMTGRTVLVIAHRLSTIQSCDEICVMDAGRIVERGSHEELLARNGRYAKFYRLQFKIAS